MLRVYLQSRRYKVDEQAFTLSSSAALFAQPWTMVGTTLVLICEHALCSLTASKGFHAFRADPKLYDFGAKPKLLAE